MSAQPSAPPGVIARHALTGTLEGFDLRVSGTVFFSAGYSGILGRPGNVLVAFGID
jgi:hypothetical protein